MKHQYFGDINDYRKYGLLRCLDAAGLRVGVCWMLTPGDGRPDGQKTAYLDRPDRWRRFDPELFDCLRAAVEAEERDIGVLEASALLPGASYHGDELSDGAAERDAFFEAWPEALAGSDVVFFDPDNGLEVASVPRGGRASSRYLYWSEVAAAWRTGRSLLVFQHYRREARAPMTDALLQGMQSACGGARTAGIVTPNVLFLLAMQPEHEGRIDRALALVRERWGDQVVPALDLPVRPVEEPMMAVPPIVLPSEEAPAPRPIAAPAPAPVAVVAVPAAPAASSMDRYSINIYWSDERGFFIAEAPDLDRCWASGSTPEEALAELQVAKAAWLRVARMQGIEPPAPSYRAEAGAPLPGPMLH